MKLRASSDSEQERARRLLALEGTGGPAGDESAQTRWGQWWERHPAALRASSMVALGWGSVYLAWRLLETGTAVNLEAFCVLWLVELYNFMSLGLVWRGLAILDYVHARSLPRGQRGSRWRSAAGSSTGSSARYRRSFADASDDSTSCTHGSVCEGAVSRSTQPSHRRRSGRPRRAPSASATNASPCPKAQCPARGPGGVCRPACVRLVSWLPSFVICGRSSPPRVGDPNGAVGIPETSSLLLPTPAPSLRADRTQPSSAPTDWALRSGHSNGQFSVEASSGGLQSRVY